jgi:hypothetical protein
MSDHYAAVARAKGITEVAKPPPIPSTLKPLWWTFLALHGARSGNGMGINPISFTEIDAWCRLSRVTLDPWEVDVIRLLDNAYLESITD